MVIFRFNFLNYCIQQYKVLKIYLKFFIIPEKQ